MTTLRAIDCDVHPTLPGMKALLPYLERLGIPLVSVVATVHSPLAQKSKIVLVTGPVREACPMDLTPTTSITLAQVLGEVLQDAHVERG